MNEVPLTPLQPENPGAALPIEAPAPGLWRLLRQTLVATLVLVGIVALGGWLLQDPIAVLTEWSMRVLKLPGVFAAVLMADTFTFPITPDTYLFAGVAAKSPLLPLVGAVALASIAAGTAAYHLGPRLARLPFLARKVELHRERGEAFFARYGIWAVGLAAVTPLPYSVFSYLAGIYKMPYARFLLATLLRAPRFVGYVLLFRVVWTG